MVVVVEMFFSANKLDMFIEIFNLKFSNFNVRNLSHFKINKIIKIIIKKKKCKREYFEDPK